jgi:DNA-binding FadR family transcriptional regulator
MQVRRTVEVGAAQLAIKVATDSDLIARDTKNRVI